MIHETADVANSAEIGAETRIWHQAQIREGAVIGRECIVGKGVYVDIDVKVGSRVKIENYASLFHGAVVEDGVFIGPYSCLTNDRFPRAISPTGELKTADDWTVAGVLVKYGASVGAGAILLPGVIVGRFAMVGAGAVVSRSIPDFGLVVGNPARLIGFVCQCGNRLLQMDVGLKCRECGRDFNTLDQELPDRAPNQF